SRRFSPEVVSSVNIALDQLKAAAGKQHLTLIGFSGGGAIALLAAARRNDVNQLVTVAGNLDSLAWTRLHRISELKGSLNPADDWQALQDIPQVHLVGEDDAVAPLAIAQSYANHYPAGNRPNIRVIEGFSHHCCWEQQWPQLLNTVLKPNP